MISGTFIYMMSILLVLWILAVLSHSGMGHPHWSIRPAVRLKERIREHWKTPAEPVPSVLLELELQRLAAYVRAVEGGDELSKAARLAAIRLAYDKVLLDLCVAADVPAPRQSPPLSADERFEAESALVGAGHGW